MQRLICTMIVLSWSAPLWATGQPSVEAPTAPAEKLVLEDVSNPGTMVDVSALYGKENKPLFLYGICPE